MSEVQSCSSLVNPSALCGRSRVCSLDFSAPLECKDQQVLEGESVNRVIAKLSAELQKERKKNAELMEKVSLLEAQIEEMDNGSNSKTEQDDCPIVDRSFKKLKRQKIEPRNDEVEQKEGAQTGDLTPDIKHDTSRMDLKDDANQQDRLVNWMSLDDTQFLNFEKFKDVDFTADCEDTDDSDDDGDEYCDDDAESDDNGRKVYENPQFDGTLNAHIKEEIIGGGQKEQAVINMIREISGDLLLPETRSIMDKKELKKHQRRVNKKVIGCKELFETPIVGQNIGNKGFGNISSHKKQPKLPFCPKEIKRMIGSEPLLLKNAQSHTIRKIIVFASLGIRHGCDDMYDLDFNHFSILRKGELYVSATNPGEHVLYEHPGVRRKIFYPNRQNPTLCPVQILEEEKVMRPSDPSCPSCLFLCIKYGGRTRNLPQNEYVRQRMGRNKLKSFGPLMCQMAMLVNIRRGSFVFKALGITLLFMAGFSDDLVQKETKYCNLDLLQKYYRKDEDAEGEEMFDLCPVLSDAVSPTSQPVTVKTTKPSGRKQIGSIKPRNLPVTSIIPFGSSSSSPPPEFGLMGYASLQPHAMAAFQSIPPHTVKDTLFIPPSPLTASSPNIPYHTNHTATPYPIFPPPHPASLFMPMVYWPHTNAFPTCPYPPSYSYQSFPHSTNYSLHPQPYYDHLPCMPFMPKAVEGFVKKDKNLGEAHSNSGSSSSSSEPKKE